MKNTISKFHKEKPEYAFLIRLAISYGILEGTHQYLKSIQSGIEILNTLTYYVAFHTKVLVELFGQNFEIKASAYGKEFYQIGYATYINSNPGVYIAYDCNGFELLVAFIAFLIAFNFKWNKHLLWFVPVGLAIIHFINVLRVIGLMIIYEINPAWLEINHKYIFTIIVYAAILGLLYWWVSKFSSLDIFKWNKSNEQ